MPEELCPARLHELQDKDGMVSIPYHIVDWATYFNSSAPGDKSYRTEAKAMMGVLERARNFALKLEINFGFSKRVVLLSDSKSVLSRVLNDNGMCMRTDICTEEVAMIKDAFTSSLLKLLFINDTHNLADIFTKHHPAKSEKVQMLLKLMESGIWTLPYRALQGRAC